MTAPTRADWDVAHDISYQFELPPPSQPPRRHWRPDPRRATLLVHDMQHYFLRRFATDAEPANSLLCNVTTMVQQARRLAVPVFYTAQPGGMDATDRGLLADFWGQGMTLNELDRGIPRQIAPRPQDTVLTKWRYSAFHRTDLLQRIRQAGRDQLIIVGVYARIGILTTALDSYSHDLETFLVADAVADFTAPAHIEALAHAGRSCAAVLSTATVAEQLTSSAATARSST